ncbi:MAG: hypothetical protein WDW38_010875 [Sanguina aurantia]
MSVIDPAAVSDGRRKFLLALEGELLDYKHNVPQHIENCANMLIKIFTNVIENPAEEKYRSIKATSNALMNNVFNVKGGEHLLQLAGWRTQVVELQKSWVFDSAPDSTRFSILKEALSLLNKALFTIHDKAERKKNEKEEKANKDKAQRDKILAALAEDKQNRIDRAARDNAAYLGTVGSASAEPTPVEGVTEESAASLSAQQKATAAAAEARVGGNAAQDEAL